MRNAYTSAFANIGGGKSGNNNHNCIFDTVFISTYSKYLITIR